jgi:hypothetical protein
MDLLKNAMPMLEDIFDALRQVKVFSILDLRFGYHEMPLREGDKVKTTFWGWFRKSLGLNRGQFGYGVPFRVFLCYVLYVS